MHCITYLQFGLIWRTSKNLFHYVYSYSMVVKMLDNLLGEIGLAGMLGLLKVNKLLSLDIISFVVTLAYLSYWVNFVNNMLC